MYMHLKLHNYDIFIKTQLQLIYRCYIFLKMIHINTLFKNDFLFFHVR